ncbi:MAG: hypothetical protein AB7U29_20090 [Desulfobulbus sp.]
MVETAEWLKRLSRMLRAAGRRVGDADEHELAQLVRLRSEFDKAIKTAVEGQRSSGRSWAHIGKALGLSRQGAFKRYGNDEVNNGN